MPTKTQRVVVGTAHPTKSRTVELLAELDNLLTTRLGTDAELDFLDGLTDGAYVLIHPTADDLIRCRELIARYRDLPAFIAPREESRARVRCR